MKKHKCTWSIDAKPNIHDDYKKEEKEKALANFIKEFNEEVDKEILKRILKDKIELQDDR